MKCDICGGQTIKADYGSGLVACNECSSRTHESKDIREIIADLEANGIPVTKSLRALHEKLRVIIEGE